MLSENNDVYKSGGQINTVFALVDKYGNIVTTDSSSKLYVTTVNTYINTYTQTVNTSQYDIVSGIFNVTYLTVIGQPNSK